MGGLVRGAFLRFPRRGGNYNNTSNAGLGYVNSNNTRGNTNTNYGARPRSRSFQRFLLTLIARDNSTDEADWEGCVSGLS